MSRERSLRRPYARQWSRLVSTYEGSGSLVAGSSIDVAFTGSKYFPPSGKNYRFSRADIYFSMSDTKRVILSISNSQKPWIHHASESNINRLTVEDDAANWMIEKYDPLRLRVDNCATGYCWYKLYGMRYNESIQEWSWGWKRYRLRNTDRHYRRTIHTEQRQRASDNYLQQYRGENIRVDACE